MNMSDVTTIIRELTDLIDEAEKKYEEKALYADALAHDNEQLRKDSRYWFSEFQKLETENAKLRENLYSERDNTKADKEVGLLNEKSLTSK